MKQQEIIIDYSEELRAQERYGGKKRSDLKDSDFLYPKDRAFPITGPSDVRDALNNWGRSKREGTYEAFVRKLYNWVKNKNSAWLSGFPEQTLKRAGIKKS